MRPIQSASFVDMGKLLVLATATVKLKGPRASAPRRSLMFQSSILQ